MLSSKKNVETGKLQRSRRQFKFWFAGTSNSPLSPSTTKPKANRMAVMMKSYPRACRPWLQDAHLWSAQSWWELVRSVMASLALQCYTPPAWQNSELLVAVCPFADLNIFAAVTNAVLTMSRTYSTPVNNYFKRYIYMTGYVKSQFAFNASAPTAPRWQMFTHAPIFTASADRWGHHSFFVQEVCRLCTAERTLSFRVIVLYIRPVQVGTSIKLV